MLDQLTTCQTTPRCRPAAGSAVLARARQAGGWSGWTLGWSMTLTPPVPGKPTLSTPTSGTLLSTPTPTFTWGTGAGATRTRFRSTTSGSFASPALDVLLPDGVMSYTASPLPDGVTYYWRVRGINVQSVAGAWSATWSIKLNAVGQPVLVTPANGARTGDNTPTFTWGGVGGATSYQLQIALDSKFTALLQTGTPTASNYTATTLADGKVYWRVRGVSGAGVPGLWSVVYNVTVDTTGPAAATLTVLVNGKGTNDTTPKLVWLKVNDATSYRIQIDNDADFSSPALNTTSPVPNYTVTTPLSYSTYYWRIQGTDVLGNVGAWSQTGRFAVTILKSPNDGASTIDNTPAFKWLSFAGAVNYQFEVDNTADFSSPVATYTGLNLGYTVTTPLAGGTYYWRVCVDTGSGCGWMPAWTLTVTTAPPAKPVQTAPAKNQLTNDNTPTFTWSSALGGTQYELQIDNNSVFRSPDQTVTQSGLLFTAAPLADGKWYWRVRAINSDGAPGAWSQKLAFTVDTTPPVIPLLVSPANAATSTNTKLKIEWVKVTGATRYELQLQPQGATIPVIDMSNKTKYTPPTPLDYGTYEWRVRAVDKANNPSGWSEWRTFTIVAGITMPGTSDGPDGRRTGGSADARSACAGARWQTGRGGRAGCDARRYMDLGRQCAGE